MLTMLQQREVFIALGGRDSAFSIACGWAGFPMLSKCSQSARVTSCRAVRPQVGFFSRVDLRVDLRNRQRNRRKLHLWDLGL